MNVVWVKGWWWRGVLVVWNVMERRVVREGGEYIEGKVGDRVVKGGCGEERVRE